MNKSLRNNAQSGFTLIELIVVIVILGILAATALPKFTSLGGDARWASLLAAKGALSSTAAMAKGKFLVNTTGTPLTDITVEGSKITFVHSYPKADAGFAEAAGLNLDYGVLVGPVTGSATKPGLDEGEVAIIPKSVQDTAASLTCYLKYTQPTAAGAAPTYTMVGSATGCA